MLLVPRGPGGGTETGTVGGGGDEAETDPGGERVGLPKGGPFYLRGVSVKLTLRSGWWGLGNFGGAADHGSTSLQAGVV